VKIETYRRSAQVTVGFVYTINDGKVSTVKINKRGNDGLRTVGLREKCEGPGQFPALRSKSES
jgi:hypothetical protein